MPTEPTYPKGTPMPEATTNKRRPKKTAKPTGPTLDEWKASAPIGQEALQRAANALGGEITAQGFDANGQPVGPALKATPVYDSPEALAAWDAETARLVSDEEIIVSDLEAVHEDRKAQAKAAKESLELGECQLRTLIRDRRAGRGKPPQPTLYDGPPADSPDGKPT